MMSSIAHRGPDDEGYLAANLDSASPSMTSFVGPDSPLRATQPDIGMAEGTPHSLLLGHRRLSILDVSERGHQPMRRGTCAIVFNGEIYNYAELADELRALGHYFESTSDTEVILAAYQQWGERCVERFNGDWAFCILDLTARTLLLSRDRYGIKPLYFYQDSDHLCFASEMKALLALPFISAPRNPIRREEEILFSLVDHDDTTQYSSISQIPPATNCTVSLPSGRITTRKFYALSINEEMPQYEEKRAQSYLEEIRPLLTDAVRLRLRSDVPLGACLSGGLDSSVVTAIAANLLGTADGKNKFHTFTAGFPGTPLDETNFASIVANHTNVAQHLVFPQENEFRSGIAALLKSHDEPFGGPSVYSQFEIYRTAAQHVKVVLDGQGADEVFGGYRNFRIAYFCSLLRSQGCGALIKDIRLLHERIGFGPLYRELRLFPFFLLPRHLRLLVFAAFRPGEMASYLKLTGRSYQEILSRFELRFSSSCIRLMANYLLYSSLPHLLRYVDRSSMACSIEARTPYTDHRLVDLLYTIPATYKFHNGWTKWLLRRAAEDLLPPEIIWRRDKLGFATPAWATKSDIYDRWERTCTPHSGVSKPC